MFSHTKNVIISSSISISIILSLATINCLLALLGEGDNAMNLIVLYSKEFVNLPIHKFPVSLGSSGSC